MVTVGVESPAASSCSRILVTPCAREGEAQPEPAAEGEDEVLRREGGVGIGRDSPKPSACPRPCLGAEHCFGCRRKGGHHRLLSEGSGNCESCWVLPTMAPNARF